MSAFIWENFDNPKLRELKNKFALDEVIREGRNEFDKQLLLKKWVSGILPLGYNNTNQYQSASEVLDDKDNSGGFNCTWYVLVYLQCATALGWYARKLGIDTDHTKEEEEKRHTVVDIWSNDFNKWYVVDPMFNCHFEKNGIPLNAFEIRKSWLEKDASVKKIFGCYEAETLSPNVKDRYDVQENYFWSFVLTRNNFLEDPDVYNSKALLWIDEYNENKTWYVGGAGKGDFRKHPMYEGAFIPTKELKVLYPIMK